MFYVFAACISLLKKCFKEVLQKAGCSLFKVLVLCENTGRDTQDLLQSGRASGMEVCHVVLALAFHLWPLPVSGAVRSFPSP